MLWMFNPTTYSYLQFDTVDYAPEPETSETARARARTHTHTHTHTQSLVVNHWRVFLKPRPFVKRNNADFTNVSSFTSLLMCSTHCTLSCRILLSLPTSNNIFKFVYSEIPEESAWQLGVVCFSGNWRSSDLDSLQFWTSDFQDLPISCRKFLYFTFFFFFCVLYTKNGLKSAQCSRYNTTLTF
jgi:hypothetical protein